MVIVFVTDTYCMVKNGTSMTCRRFVEGLQEKGHEVRVISIGDKAPDNYYVDEWKIPFVSWLASQSGFMFAKFDRKTAERAIQGADVVHFTLPTPFNHQVLKVAHRMGVPCTAAYHLQPENFTYIAHLNNWPKSSEITYEALRRYFFKHILHIHCPSMFIAEQLRDHNYKGKLHVISNGVAETFKPDPDAEKDENYFDILMVGRLSPEKNQILLVEAVRKSKYQDKIRIFFAGEGTHRHKLIQKGKFLTNQPDIRFYEQSDLIKRMQSCDLYVHTSSVEIESIACLEALSTGLVPVINNAAQSAAVQFALDDRSLFEEDSAESLAEKIDYWIEHPEEKAEMVPKYIEKAKQYDLNTSIDKIEKMFEQAVVDFENGTDKWSNPKLIASLK